VTRIFVTGASGWIGSALVPELLAGGHEVVGLARSDASAAALEDAGATVQRGSLDDLEALGAGASASDGVIHLAFKHEDMFAGDFQAAIDADGAAIQAFCEALADTGRPLVIASGLAWPGWRPARRPPSRTCLTPPPRPASAASASGLHRPRRPGRSRQQRALAADRPRGRRPGVHGNADSRRPGARHLGLHRRRGQPLARRAPPRRRAPPAPCDGACPGKISAARHCRARRADPGHRRGHR